MNDPEKQLKEMIQKLRKREGLCPMTDDEADAAFDAAPADPMSKEQIRSIVDLVTSGNTAPWDDAMGEPVWDDEIDVSEVEEGLVCMHRNEGESDKSADAIEDELRDELLSQEDEEQTGMDEGEGSAGTGQPAGG
ncbi:MAG TPA: hypothetical protein VMP01_18360 [Pirellulaceae bacterium]|nr:hypothetical protein [Pirellulaceae bacterium]